jgi:alkanesulfonate monooxygenase SsuD/methylene tetrahydromethanopterin reductase-like flavin-dependent oxidoreductase (luciferase family)
MRFSIIAGPRQRADLGQSASDAWWNYVNDAVLADQLGYDSAFIGEHHFCFASGNSAPFTMLTHIAARTERIRIGTSVLCMPFHHPLTAAEQIAAVDIVSKGRFDFGVGVGSQYEEFETFGIPPAERFGRTWEAIDLIERCLHGNEEVFTHEGKYFKFPNVRWIIPPYQSRVPIFWGGFGPQGVTKAAERGYHLIAPDVTGIYDRVMRQHGRDPARHHIGFVFQVGIGKTAEQAFEAVAEPCLWVSNVYQLRRNLDGTQPLEASRFTMEQLREAARTGTHFGAGGPFATPVTGTVEDVINAFLPVVRGERGLITHIGIEVRPPGTKTQDVERTMTLFAKEVMPVLKAEAAKRGI